MAYLVHCFNITNEELILLTDVGLDDIFIAYGLVIDTDHGHVIGIREADMNKAIRCLTEYAENVYLGEHPGGNIDLATRLAGAFRRCLAIGVVN